MVGGLLRPCEGRIIRLAGKEIEMAFFDVPKLEDVSSEARRWFEELGRLRGVESFPPSWMSYARSPRILEARVKSETNLLAQSGPGGKSGFSWEARMIGFMLIAHARRCQGCFGSSRRLLTTLGFDESTLDGFCANPSDLPLSERDRLFVRYVLKIAISPADLRPKDLREMEAHGLSREDVQEIIGCAAFSVFNTIFTTAANTALSDE